MSWRDLFNRDVRDEARHTPPQTFVNTVTPEQAEEFGRRFLEAVKSHKTTVVPRNNVLCGHQYEDGTICRAYAGPDHDPLAHSEADEKISDPAPGLYETISGKPLPRYAELRARYGDPRDLPPVKPACKHEESMYGRCTACGATWEEQAAARQAIAGIPVVVDPSLPKGVGEIRSGDQVQRVDFREMLTTDQAWTVKARLEVALGRPYLATKLAEQLDPETAAKLCDRLEALLSTAYDQARAHIAGEIAEVVDLKMQQIRENQDRAKEVTHERFARRSRLD